MKPETLGLRVSGLFINQPLCDSEAHSSLRIIAINISDNM